MRELLGVALLLSILLSGCGSSDSTAKEVSKNLTQSVKKSNNKIVEVAKKPEQKAVVVKKTKTEKSETKKPKSSQPKVSKFYTIFKDGAKIAPDGKYMLIMFGQDSDPYTKKIRNDIVSDDDLSSKIKEIVTPIYIDARGQKAHKFMHNAELMDVDTKTLVSIYNVNSTPTLIFADKDGNHILVVPGYMPPEQFKITLDFIKSEKWRGKDRKNGDIYEELKKFYEENGIEIKAAKP